MNLYEISNQYLDALNGLKNLDADEQTIKDTLESMSLVEDFNEKSVAVASFFQNMEAEANAIKEAEKRMELRRKSIESRVDYLKSYLKSNMERTGITSIECPYFKISLVNNPPSVSVIDESLLPQETINEKVVREVVKTAIKEYINKHGACPGAEIKHSKRLKIC